VHNQNRFLPAARRGSGIILIATLVLLVAIAPRSWGGAVRPAASPAPASCPTSLASLDGWYAVLVSGQTTAAAPAAKYLAGALQFNGAGAATADHIYDGTGAAASATGTYVLNSDCTLTLTLTVGSSIPQVYTLGVNSAGGAVGVETDSAAVATIDLQAQYASVTTGLNFTSSSLNGTFAAACLGPEALSSDVNLATYSNGTVTGTDPFNNAGGFSVSNVPYAGTYAVNSDGTFTGSVTVLATPFDFYGVISAGGEIEYLYSSVANGVPTGAFAACSGGTALAAALPGFTLSPASGTLKLAANSGGTDVITVTDAAGFSGTVTLAVAGAPAGVSTAISGTTLVVFAGPGAVVGTYPLTITGTSGTLTATTSVSLVVTPELTFTLSASPASLSVIGGNAAATKVTVAPVNGFASTVGFSAGGLPAGASATFSPASSQTGTTLSIATTTSTPAGTYTVTVTGTAAATGTSNAVSATTSLGLTVVAALKTQTITFAAIGAQTVGTPLSLVASASSGLPVGFASTTPSVCTVSATTASFVLAGTCTIVASQGGNATYAAATPVSRSFSVAAAVVPGFSLSAGAAVLGLVQGQSGTDSISVSPSNGFAGTVAFSVSGVPAGASATFQPATSTSGTTLEVSAGPATAPGSYALSVTGTSDSQRASIDVTLQVAAAGVTAVNLAGVANVDGIATLGAAARSGGLDTSGYAYAASLLGTAVGWNGATFALLGTTQNNAVTSSTITLPAGQFTSLSFLGTAIYGARGNQAFVVNYTDGTTTTLTQSLSDWGGPQHFPGESTALAMAYRITPAGGAQVGPWYLYGYSIGLDPTKTVRSLSLPNNRGVVVLAVDLTIGRPPGFSISAATSSVALAAGQSASDAIAVADVNGFSSPVSFAASALPGGVTAAFSPASAVSSAGLTLTAAAYAAPGSYPIVVTAGANGLAATTTLLLVVTAPSPSFTLSAQSTNLSVTPPTCFFFICYGGSSASDVFTVKPRNGFNSGVQFAISGVPAGVSASFNPATLWGGGGSSTLTIVPSASANRHASTTLEVTATSGSGASALSTTINVQLSY